jgi:gliding motility-associated-like protein
LNNNGSYADSVDVILTKDVVIGADSILWNGQNGQGVNIPANPNFNFSYELKIRGGEVHLLMLDVENNVGGVTFTRINGVDSPDSTFYYDHSNIGGGVSGGGTAGNPLPTTEAFVYSNGFGNNRLLDQWAFIETSNFGTGTLAIIIEKECSSDDNDNDGIIDIVDIDDDNDGVPDLLEYCHPDEGWACLPNGLDPSGDEDNDGIQNYLDANDAAVNNACTDDNNDGICDQILAIYDTDGDNVPDHFDLDSDNDGISDLVEAGHNQADADANGVIDGDSTAFGANGLFNLLETNDTPTGEANYTPWDVDADGIPDHDDLDSDNDGILDVVEAGYATSDSNQDGRIDDGNGNVPTVSAGGLTPKIDPAVTGEGIPLPPDWDGDGVPDWHDLDSDNDGIVDVVEAGHTASDTNQDGRIDDGNGNVPTVNADGLPPVIANAPIALPPDWDGDGVEDWHDLDSDNDGILDVVEGGYKTSDTNQDGRIDDGNGNIPTVNADGLPPVMDPAITNTPINLPPDWDSDNVPDWHDLDSDNDGILDVIEGGYQGSDTNLDGRIDDGSGNIPTVNKDGLAPIMDPAITNNPINLPPDTDSDGVEDWHDLDSDNDGINGTVENINPDGDGDGFIGTGPITVDANGIATADANGPITPNTPLVNTDNDGPGDFRDLDADGDAINDVIEGGLNDPDTDGIVGTGVPTVNDFGQATEGTSTITTSNPPDTDGNDTPDFQQIDACTTPATPTLSAANTEFCAGSSMTLTASADTTSNISYEWTITRADNSTELLSTTTTPTLTIDALDTTNNGTYTVVAKVDTCASAASNGIAITINPQPEAPVLSVDNDVFCEGQMLAFTATEVAGDDVSYVWLFTLAGSGRTDTITVRPLNTLEINNLVATNTGDYTVVAIVNGCPSEPSNMVSIDVASGGLPDLAASSSAPASNPGCVGDNVTLSAPGVENATYAWTGPNGFTSTDSIAIIENATADANGEYTVTVTVNGCPKTLDPVTVQLEPKPATPTISADDTNICPGEGFTLSTAVATGTTISYDWTLNGTVIATTDDPELIVSGATTAEAGTYAVIVKDGNCASDPSEGVLINVEQALEGNISMEPTDGICEGETVTLSAPTADGATYAWTGPNGFTSTDSVIVLENVMAANNGDYAVTVTVNDCPTSFDPITLEVSPKPAKPTISADNTNVCPGEGFTLSTPAVTGTNISYDWLLNGTVVMNTDQPELAITTPTEANAGAYTVIVKEGSCPSDPSDSIDITVQPAIEGDISMEPTDGICEGETVTLSAPTADGATYAWTGPNGFTSTDSTIVLENVTAANNGDYAVVVTLNNCPNNFGPITLTVSPKPAKPTISADNTNVCPGEGFTLSTPAVTGTNISYDWLLNGTVVMNTDQPELAISSPTEANAGAYTVIVKEGTCPSDPSDSIDITVQPAIEGDIMMDPTGGVCEGETVTLSAPTAEGATYAWTGPNGFTSTDSTIVLENVTAANNGDYAVVVTLNDCPNDFGPVNLTINPKPATPTLSADKQTVCPGEAVTFSTAAATGDAITYEWSLNGAVVATTDVPSFEIPDFQAANAGDYTLVVKDGSCPSEPSDSVTVNTTDALTDATASSNSPVCIGDTLQLMATEITDATYAWTGPNNFTSTDQNPSIANAAAENAGDYTVIITVGSCMDTLPPVNVEVTPKPQAPTIGISDTSICEGMPVTITVTEPATIPDGTTFTVMNAEGTAVGSSNTATIEINTDGLVGMHVLTVTAQQDGGCPSEASNPVNLEVTAKPDESAMILEPDMSGACGEAPTSIEAVAPTQGTGTWSSTNADIVFAEPNNPITNISGLAEGDNVITWTLTNEACGEYASDQITVTVMSATITANNDNFTILNTESVTNGNIIGNDTPTDGTITIISGPSNGTATLSGNAINYTPNATFTGTDQVTYELCNTACPNVPCQQATITFTVNQDPNNLVCRVPDVISPNSDGLNDALVIPCSDFKNVAIKIFNRWGDKVYESTNYQNNWMGTHDGEPLPPGPYYYIFEEDGAEPTTGCVSIAR